MPTVTFCTFCCYKDAHLVHKPGQLRKQIESNQYDFDEIIVVHQKCNPLDYEPFNIYVDKQPIIEDDAHIDEILSSFGFDLDKPQYISPTDSHHWWKYHCVNHIYGIGHCTSDYILFADADCWMKEPISWIPFALDKMQNDDTIFLSCPNEGEPERKEFRMSQQIFLIKADDFRNIDFNQPGFSGNVNDYDTMPEYHAMGEGRIEYYCRSIGKYRYVLPPKYRGWHHNRYNEKGHYLTDYEAYFK